MKKETLIVYSSNGELEVSKTTGKIVGLNITDADGCLEDIRTFDIWEWEKTYKRPLPDTLDILDLGYWYIVPGEFEEGYEGPMEEWRKEFRK